MVQTLLLLFVLFVPFVGHSQSVAAPIGPANVRIQSLHPGERPETILAAGQLAYDESNPAILYLGDGHTPGGIRVSPPVPEWDHSATKDIRLNGYRLHLGNGYSFLTLGGYHALSGIGELQATPGFSSWSVNSVALITLVGAESLVNIDTFSWHPADGDNGQFQLLINVGDSEVLPILQTTDNLVTAIWTDLTPASIGPIIDGTRLLTVDYVPETTLQFFRVLRPAGTSAIQLRTDTTITGDLTVSGTIPRAADIDDGVTAHTWGNHATAGYLTVQQHASITTVAVDANTAITPVMDGDVFVTTHSGNFTLTINDPAAPTRAIRVVIETRQDATGGRTVTWAGNLSTPGAVVPPALTSTANAIDVWTWQYTGTRWRLVGVTFAQGNL